jgi:hypothetical protein
MDFVYLTFFYDFFWDKKYQLRVVFSKLLI